MNQLPQPQLSPDGRQPATGDYRPESPARPTTDVLSTVYSFILGWPKPGDTDIQAEKDGAF